MGKLTYIKPEWFLKRRTKRRQKPQSHPLVNLLSAFRPTVVELFLVSTWIFFLLRVFTALGPLNYLFASVLGLFLILRSRWLWPLIVRTYNFIPFESTRVRLFYEPHLGGIWKPSVFVEDCERHLQDLTGKLGVRLPKKLRVFHFARSKDISQIFGEHYGATALIKLNAIVIASGDYVQETIRHELTHLLASKWNSGVPPLLSEGIATWLAGSWWGQSIDSTAQAILLNSPPKLELLLRRKFFFSGPNRDRCYTLAASFTGFLIRHHGFKKYQRLYSHSYNVGFKPGFKQLVGTAFDNAEAQWREEIISGKWSRFER